MNIINKIKYIFQKTSGQAMVEYALIAVCIGLAMVWVANSYFEGTKVNYYNGMVPLSKGEVVPPPPESMDRDSPAGNKKPVAQIDGPLKGSIGKKLIFKDVSYDLDGTIMYTTWGSKTIERTFNEVGTYRIELEVIDNQGAKGKVEIEVVISDNPPVAVITKSNAKLSLVSKSRVHGENSYDEDGDKIVSGIWYLTEPNGTRKMMDWGLDGYTFEAGELKSGIYKVELQVTDEFQNKSEWAITTFQVNVPPIAVVSASPKPVSLGKNVTLSSSGTYDPDGDAITETKWTIIAPNGSRTVMSWGLGNNSYKPLTSGQYRVELMVKDAINDWSVVATDTFLVKSAPTAIIGYSPVKSIYESTDTINFHGLNSFDSDGDTIVAAEWYRVKNGSRTKLSWGLSGGSYRPTAGSGLYSFELRVKDSSGEWSSYTSISFNVNNQKPTLTIYHYATGDYNDLRSSEITNRHFVSPNKDVRIYTFASDPNGDSIVEAEWYITKDGVRSKLDFTTANGGTLTGSQFSLNGTNTVEVRVKDSAGLWSDWASKEYIVNEQPIVKAEYTYGPWPLRVDTTGTYDPDGYIVQIEVKRDIYRLNGTIETDNINWHVGMNYVYGHPNYQANEEAYFSFRVKDNKGEWSNTHRQGYIVLP